MERVEESYHALGYHTLFSSFSEESDIKQHDGKKKSLQKNKLFQDLNETSSSSSDDDGNDPILARLAYLATSSKQRHALKPFISLTPSSSPQMTIAN